jgi:hypothetical protein
VTRLGARAWQGVLGALAPVATEHNAWAVDEYPLTATEIRDYCTGSACDWYLVFLAWTDLVCAPVTYTGYGVDARFHFSGLYVDEPAGLAAQGAWETADGPASGHSWFRWEWRPGPRDASGVTSWRRDPIGYTVQGVGCAPRAPTVLPPYTAGEPADRQPIAMALEVDAAGAARLAVWAYVYLDEPRLARWRPGGGWEGLLRGGRLRALSRDGTDALAMTGTGQTVFTLDGGATWTPCPPLPAPEAAIVGQAARYSDLFFVDELA